MLRLLRLMLVARGVRALRQIMEEVREDLEDGDWEDEEGHDKVEPSERLCNAVRQTNSHINSNG
jgi:hypothetical protein